MMKIEEFCPYCDKLIKVDITEDYWEFDEEEELKVEDVCPECNKKLKFYWETSHSYNLTKGE